MAFVRHDEFPWLLHSRCFASVGIRNDEEVWRLTAVFMQAQDAEAYLVEDAWKLAQGSNHAGVPVNGNGDRNRDEGPEPQ